MPPSAAADPATRLNPKAALALRAAIRLAGGREVCFVATLDADGIVQTVRAVARGDSSSVLALPGFAARGEMLVHNHPSGSLEPSEPDLAVAARLHDDGIGFAIVDNAATELYVVVEVPAARALNDLGPDAIDRDLGPDGPIARQHARYEDRPSQRAMAAEIARLYNDGGVGLLEAGTGVGKSLGYLVPALRWAHANNERTIVSTATINLQEQLVGKDLPFLADALDDQKVRFALLKGWRNYLCLVRLEQARASGNALFEDGLQQELDAIQQWSERTRDGSLSDLTITPRAELWDEVAAEPDVCQRARCPAYSKCFLFQARKQAAEADVIVVNHHLLLSDLAVRRASGNWGEAAVLPAYTRLVIDEGHHLEDAAASHLGSTVSRRSLQRLFNRLDRRGRGLLSALIARLSASNDLLSVASLDLVGARLSPAVHAARDKSALLFDLLDTFLHETGESVVRLTEDFTDHPVWKAGLRLALQDTLGEIELLAEGLQLVRERIEGGKRPDDAVMPLLNEMRSVTRRLQMAGDGLKAALDPGRGAPTVRWIEAKGRDRAVSVSTVPLDLAPILREDLFKRATTTIVTSATLATDGKFNFLADRLGLVEEVEPRTGIFPSPFKYREQALLAVPSDIPAPNVNASGHFAAVARAACDLANAANGGMFVLFTSHKDVRAMASELRARGVDRRWPLLVHGDEMRDQLLARFRESGGAVLLGTTSFWEGVDVPGDALRALLIAKLPFRVPTEPVTAAHCEAIQARGGDSFKEYMLPHAALRLKQGFGRLVRTAADRGVVVLADPRVVTKNYGRGLLDGLPPARRIIGRWPELLETINSFYQR
ncbi:MAG TPA: helicase C-terminal domain-containing protein [Gemmatimonadaceae bacterium]|jgi:ATP-dependent DNA helicase DinG|nr:helicase C-terminal domain-containing protein [Gemmatimonadaceae bacterium]